MIETWPPPTQGMNVEQLIELRKVAKDFLRHLENAIPDQCGREGHKWDEPSGKEVQEEFEEVVGYSGGDCFERSSPITRLSTNTVFIRTCKLCGVTERRSPITKLYSPFEKGNP